jgi:hypothetical protein
MHSKLSNSCLGNLVATRLRECAQGIFLLPELMIRDLATATEVGEIYAFFNDPGRSFELPSIYSAQNRGGKYWDT